MSNENARIEFLSFMVGNGYEDANVQKRGFPRRICNNIAAISETPLVLKEFIFQQFTNMFNR